MERVTKRVDEDGFGGRTCRTREEQSERLDPAGGPYSEATTRAYDSGQNGNAVPNRLQRSTVQCSTLRNLQYFVLSFPLCIGF